MEATRCEVCPMLQRGLYIWWDHSAVRWHCRGTHTMTSSKALQRHQDQQPKLDSAACSPDVVRPALYALSKPLDPPLTVRPDLPALARQPAHQHPRTSPARQCVTRTKGARQVAPRTAVTRCGAEGLDLWAHQSRAHESRGLLTKPIAMHLNVIGIIPMSLKFPHPPANVQVVYV